MSTPSRRRERPLGAGRGWRRRLLVHHLPLAVATATLTAVLMTLPPFTGKGFALLDMGASTPFPTSAAYRGQGGGRTAESAFTLATGYAATLLLAATLLIGPANLLLRRRTPVSTPLARDTGTWATVASLVHVVVGLKAHGHAEDLFNFRNYFFTADGTMRIDSFGLGNWVGLAALVIVVGLLALSNDRTLGELKARRWKSLQRTNYALFALVGLHAFFYGALLRMTAPFTVLLVATITIVVVGQLTGIWLWRRRRHS